MSIRVSRYNSTPTSRVQNMPRSGLTTSTTAGTRGQTGSGTTIVGTFTTPVTLTGGANFSFRIDGTERFQLFFGSGTPAGTYNMTANIAQQELLANTSLSIVNLGGNIIPFGNTATFAWRIFPLQYVVVPEEKERIWVNNGGTFAQAKEVWVAREVIDTGELEYVMAWFVPPPPPAGVSVSISQEFSVGGDIIATWTNQPDTFGMDIDLLVEINGSIQEIITIPVSSVATQIEPLPEALFQNFDQVRVRMRYLSAGELGTLGPFSNFVTYIAL